MAADQGEMVQLICVHCGGNESFMWPCTDEEELCSECQAPNPANKKIKYDSDDKEEDSEKIEINNDSSEDESSIAKAMEKGTRKRKRSSRPESNSPTPSTSKLLVVEEADSDIEEPPNKAPAVAPAIIPAVAAAVALNVPPAVASAIVISDHIFYKVINTKNILFYTYEKFIYSILCSIRTIEEKYYRWISIISYNNLFYYFYSIKEKLKLNEIQIYNKEM